MSSIQAYLRLRVRLLLRLLREIGAVRLTLLGPLLALALARGIVLAGTHAGFEWAVPLLTAQSLAAAHRGRADLRFLASSAPAFRRWMAVEYALAALAPALVVGAFGHWAAALLTVGLAAAVALLPPGREVVGSRRRRSWVRSEAFEWVSGLRGAAAWAWPVLLAGAWWQRATPLGPVVALVGWLLVLVSFFGTPEPLAMLVLAARTPGQFLRRRLGLGLGYAGLSAAPLLGLLAWGPVGAGPALGVGLVWLGLLALMILTKYAFYPNATHIRTTQALVLGVALLLPMHPAYPVLLLVAVGGLIWQSRRRLRVVLGKELPE
ncbi:MAG: hypothetical protein M3Y54_21720 [Bacteroidota bacterium]|nr:hypothetical protein [Bacteroidota bacterium]